MQHYLVHFKQNELFNTRVFLHGFIEIHSDDSTHRDTAACVDPEKLSRGRGIRGMTMFVWPNFG